VGSRKFQKTRGVHQYRGKYNSRARRTMSKLGTGIISLERLDRILEEVRMMH